MTVERLLGLIMKSVFDFLSFFACLFLFYLFIYLFVYLFLFFITFFNFFGASSHYPLANSMKNQVDFSSDWLSGVSCPW